MGEPWASIAARLRQQKLLAPKSLHQQLLDLENPLEVLDAASALNISSGMLSADQLQQMIAHVSKSPQPTRAELFKPAKSNLEKYMAKHNIIA